MSEARGDARRVNGATLSVGLGIFTGQVRPVTASVAREYADLLGLAEVAEDAGFDSFWVSEHHFAADSYLPSVLPMLAAVAARTTRLKLGTAVVLAPFHHPLRLAEDAAVVDQISDGRLAAVGLGLGWRDEEFRAFGSPRSERGARLEEIVQILRLAWSGERFSFRGPHYRCDRVRVTPTPAHPIPIWIGGSVASSIRRAGRIGDGFVASKTAIDSLRMMFRTATEAGSRERFTVAAMLDAWVGKPGELVLRGFWHKTDMYQAWREGQDVDGRDVRLPDDLTRGAPDLLFGEPSHLIEKLRPYAELEPSRPLTLIVRLHYPGANAASVASAVRRFGSEVLPRLRDTRASALASRPRASSGET